MRPVFVFVSLLALTGPLAGAPASWLHVEVTERDHRGTVVRINVPTSSLLRALPLMPDVRDGRCRFVVGEADLTAAELRRLWAQLESAPAGTLVRHSNDHVTIDADRSAGSVRFRVREHYDQQPVEVTMRESIVRALASARAADGLAGALQALVDDGGGEILLVDENDTNIRVWVDGAARSGE